MQDGYRSAHGGEAFDPCYGAGALPAPGISGASLPTIARGVLPPPRLAAIDTRYARDTPQTIVADLRFPAAAVRALAEDFAIRARAGGAPHSLRLWRVGYEQALLALARAACGASIAVPCTSLFWEERENEFDVSVTFGQPDARSEGVVRH